MNKWLLAGVIVVGGIVVAGMVGRLVQSLLSREGRPELVRRAAAPVGSLAFSVLLVAALMTALGFVNRESLETIPDDLVQSIPEILSALIVVILGHIASTIAAAGLEGALSRAPGQIRRLVPVGVRAVIMAFAVVLAASQLGVDTTIINITVAALLFSTGAAAALMVGLGSRQVSGEVAAGRALRRVIRSGDRLTVDGVHGEVVTVQSVAVEVRTADGHSVMIPNSQLLEARFSVERSGQRADGDQPGPAEET